jgi:hypothetical protein
VLYAPAFDGAYPTVRQAWIFSRVLHAGIAVTGLDIGESYGNSAGLSLVHLLYLRVTGELGFASGACLVAQSRGGLILYNWAAEHPEAVAGIVGIYSVCDLRSYPGLKQACGAYGMGEAELEANSGELVRRYLALGGPAELMVVPGFGHEEHAVFFEREDVTTTIVRYAMAGAVR